ncbi:hypothetical protein FIBSPDRAFT_894190 [Athelia psychrophila]|uniref:Carbamoyl phosphate synthase ATP-binding domain-containing protein n=1 Tax=Athelia psychrophila TaxID=1759441 RepID=A0A166G9S4_9AGAM|nr:hypothetical protein FIBSPDRAFT_894190 [Fibularhizoctonia sp. CBS 109695]
MAARTRHCAHLLSCDLAVAQDVPVAGTHVKSAAHVRALLLECGGGRGIRVVRAQEDIEEAFKRCMGESPAGQLFPEKAPSGPDGCISRSRSWAMPRRRGHLCELQHRFSRRSLRWRPPPPSTKPRNPVEPYSPPRRRWHSTFEYLVNFHTGERVFLEINPRIQVKHAVTACPLYHHPRVPRHHPSLHGPPQSCAIQLRLTAEDPAKDFRLSAELHRVARGAWGACRCVAFRCALLRGHRGLSAVGEDRGGARAGFGETTQRAVRACGRRVWGTITRRGVKMNGVGSGRWWRTVLGKGEARYDVVGEGAVGCGANLEGGA